MIWKILVGIIVVLAATVFISSRIPSRVYVERTFNAPVAKIFSMWTDVETMKKWWSPKDFTAPVIKQDFKVGGSFLYSMRSPKGEMFWNAGQFLEIIPSQKIVSSFSFSDENGKIIPGSEAPVPGKWPDAITVTVTFKEVEAGKTLMTVEEVGIPALMKLMASLGWQQQFDKMEALLK